MEQYGGGEPSGPESSKGSDPWGLWQLQDLLYQRLADIGSTLGRSVKHLSGWKFPFQTIFKALRCTEDCVLPTSFEPTIPALYICHLPRHSCTGALSASILHKTVYSPSLRPQTKSEEDLFVHASVLHHHSLFHPCIHVSIYPSTHASLYSPMLHACVHLIYICMQTFITYLCIHSCTHASSICASMFPSIHPPRHWCTGSISASLILYKAIDPSFLETVD